MAIKKSELYSSLWKSCDELRGGMDASQYKDYVLTLLFIKYVSDKYAGKADGLIEIPEGASFQDMVALKGQKDIGDQINKKIIKPLAEANGLTGTIDLTDFNDDDKLGSGKDKVDRLSELINIFENPALNFKNNRAEDDDILGDAYEFLMRHFATESGKSKGQFYTPAEVSRVLANIIEVDKAISPSYSVYDPTCGSGSLLLKVVQESPKGLSVYGQEMDNATKALAVMNMWLHNHPEASIEKGNTISTPKFKEKDGSLKRFDYVVANPPFSTKSWSNGISPMDDEFDRFKEYGIPPDKNGDYAFLLHIVASMKSTGKAAVILPHGVLFRGNAEATIRKNLIERRYIKGIIGLPANLFYGTGIPACIIVLDKEGADTREGIFMIDASKGFIKDGNKNRLREQDVHNIVDAFKKNATVDKYARFVPFAEIEANEFNLNIPRYIDTQEAEDIHDLDAHLNGGIPNADIESLNNFWKVYPSLKAEIFAPLREGYSQLNIDASEIKEAIFSHPEFKQFSQEMEAVFHTWVEKNKPVLLGIDENTKPKALIYNVAESLLEEYTNKPLVNKYDIYQHLMDYWNETMKDDAYLIVEEGWVAKLRVVKQTKKETTYDSDLVPKPLVINRYFTEEWQAIQQQEAELENLQNEFNTMVEDNSGEDGIFDDAESSRVNKAELASKLEEYENLAFAAHFKDGYAAYQEAVTALEQCESNLTSLLQGETTMSFFDKCLNAKGKLAKGNVQDRLTELQKLLTASPSNSNGQTGLFHTASADATSQPNGLAAEVNCLSEYLDLVAEQSQLKKVAKTQRHSLNNLLELQLLQAQEGEYLAEIRTLHTLMERLEAMSQLSNAIKEEYKVLEEKVLLKYKHLTPDEVKVLVVDDKWLATLYATVQGEVEAISHSLTTRIKDLAERYDITLGEVDSAVAELTANVDAHLQRMGLVWS
ncbi:type I restriction-modification system subunit M [Pontibacter mangrovi]|uniref:site-specific DNA-methyltransferase (adenine-specific) n=1 Tax=Pontibacter mangrovi TaxID=2589816 RepID=A0A501W2V1_9BACT|nr:type I restriction-modification system subunit M [Pontibacter mangrovi]TPE43608.1 type I restriction-modification system subunit M [Pontibacter mangrovi]